MLGRPTTRKKSGTLSCRFYTTAPVELSKTRLDTGCTSVAQVGFESTWASGYIIPAGAPISGAEPACARI